MLTARSRLRLIAAQMLPSVARYSEDQERDENGRFASGGGGGGGDSDGGPAGGGGGETFKVSKVDGETFHGGIAAARSGDKGAFLSLYTPQEYDAMKCYQTPDGRTGGALKDHGDGRVEIVSLYNNGGERGAGMKMFDHLVANGGNYAECYGDGLRAMYEGKGFTTTESFAFDRSLAAPDWNYEKYGEPNYYTLSLQT